MAKERRRESGLIAAWHAAAIIARLPFSAEVLDPNELNPFREARPAATKAMEELKQWQANRRWAATFSRPKKRS